MDWLVVCETNRFIVSPGHGSASQATEEEGDEFVFHSQEESATEGIGAGLVVDCAGHSDRVGDPGAISIFQWPPGLCSLVPEPEQAPTLP